MASGNSAEDDYQPIGPKEKESKMRDEETTFGTQNEIRIVLIGRTGNGKSATGNSIIKQDYFKSQLSAGSVTEYCRMGQVDRDGKKVIVVDSPGLFDTSQVQEYVKEEVTKCIAVSSPGPHAILYVLSCMTRFTKEEEETFTEMITIFGQRLYEHVIFVLTAFDVIKGNNTTIESYLENCPVFFKCLFQKCGNRVLGFNNRASDDAEKENQLTSLFDMITKINGSDTQFYYHHKMIYETEQIIREEIKKIQIKRGKEYDVVAIRAELRSQVRDQILRKESIFYTVLEMLTIKRWFIGAGGAAVGGIGVGVAISKGCTIM